MESNVANVHTSVCEVCGLLHGVTTKPPSSPLRQRQVLRVPFFGASSSQASFRQGSLSIRRRDLLVRGAATKRLTRERVATARMVEAAQYQPGQRQTASCLAHLFREKAASARLLQPAQIPFACCASGKVSLHHQLPINMRYHKVWLTQCR